MQEPEQLITRIKWSSIKDHGHGRTSFEIETVPYKQAFEEAMVNMQKIMQRMYEKDPSSFRWTVLNFSGDAHNKSVL